MFCLNCGNENTEDARFCRNCGMLLKENTSGNENAKLKKSGFKKLLVVLVILIIIFGIGTIGTHIIKEKEFRNLLAQGDDVFEQGHYEEAMQNYVKASQINEQDASIYVKIADTACKQYGYISVSEYALENYERAIRIDPGLNEAYLGIINTYLNTNVYDNISSVCDEAIGAVREKEIEQYKFIKKRINNYIAYSHYKELFHKYDSSSCLMDGTTIQTYGNCFGYLIDMDLDGIKEAVIISSDTMYYSKDVDDFKLEIWTCENDSKKLIYEGRPYRSSEGNIDVVLYETENAVCINTMSDLGTEVIYQLKDGHLVETERPKEENCDVSIYRISGSYTYEEKKYIKQAYATIDSVDYELDYLVDTTLQSVKEMLNGNQLNPIGEVPYGKYSCVTDTLNVYAWAYMDINSTDKLEVIYIPKGTGGNVDTTSNHLQFRYNLNTGKYEQYWDDFQDGEWIENIDVPEPYYLDIQMEGEQMIFELRDGYLQSNITDIILECVERW